MIKNISFRHSDAHQFCLTLPGGTKGEIETYVQYKMQSLFYILKNRNNLWGVQWRSYGPSSKGPGHTYATRMLANIHLSLTSTHCER